MMSALGQKQTYAAHQRMSALSPIATAKADIRKRSCLLYPRKRTCATQQPMSAKGQKRTSAGCHSLLFSTDRAIAGATEVYRNFVNLTGEFERRLVSEINRRANVLADVQSFVN